jgi:hypothetical protein
VKGPRTSIFRILRGAAPPIEWRAFWRQRRAQVLRAHLIVRLFYICIFVIMLEPRAAWEWWTTVATLRPVWAVRWVNVTGIRLGVSLIIWGSLAATLLAAVAPQRRVLRFLAAAGVWEFAALLNSYGGQTHGAHAWVWVSVIFIFLPDGEVAQITESTCRQQHFLLVFWLGQTTILLFYTFSGTMKLAAATLQMLHGQVGALSPEALPRHIAYALGEGRPAIPWPIGDFLVNHPFVAWPMFLLAIYLESCSLIVAFRPAAQRVWAIGLILMHLMIYFAMAIMFSWQILLVGLMVLTAPLAGNERVLGDLSSLPLLGDLWHALRRSKHPTHMPRVSEAISP